MSTLFNGHLRLMKNTTIVAWKCASPIKYFKRNTFEGPLSILPSFIQSYHYSSVENVSMLLLFFFSGHSKYIFYDLIGQIFLILLTNFKTSTHIITIFCLCFSCALYIASMYLFWNIPTVIKYLRHWLVWEWENSQESIYICYRYV